MCDILRKLQGLTAKEILEKYNVSVEPPIDIVGLLNSIGICTKQMDFGEIEQAVNCTKDSILGVTISDGNNLSIICRNKDSNNRQRFTLAHELAHCCLHTESLETKHVEFREVVSRLSTKEIEANIFAGELLIPEHMILRECEKFIIPQVNALAEIFRVSITAMEARLKYLKIQYWVDTKDAE